MNILSCGILLLSIAFFIHLVIWKIYLPRHHTNVLLGIFIGILLCGIFTLRLFNILQFGTIYEYLQLSLLYISLMLAYLTTYSAIEVDSPSLFIVIIIHNKGSQGLYLKEMDEVMTDDYLIKPRLRDMASDGVIYLDGEKYKLTRKGFLLARIFILYRRLINRGKGG